MKIGKIAVSLAAAAVMGAFSPAFAQTAANPADTNGKSSSETLGGTSATIPQPSPSTQSTPAPDPDTSPNMPSESSSKPESASTGSSSATSAPSDSSKTDDAKQ